MDKKIAIINGALFIKNKFKKGNIFIENDKIKKISFKEVDNAKLNNYKIIDAANCYVSYGFIDPHVHFRTPGNEQKEDWVTGPRAAIKGGYTFVIDMPNNNPPAIDVQTIIKKNEIAKKSNINYGFYLGLTDQNSNYINNIFSEIKYYDIPVFGIKVFLGSSTGDLLIKNLSSIKKSLKTSIINLFHCEDEETLQKYKNITYKTILDHNFIRPVEAEINGLKKIIQSCKNFRNKVKIYICHVSSKKEIESIKIFKKKGYKIISEVTPHHLFFNLENIPDSTQFKVNPPIRSQKNVESLRKNFNKGFFDIIGTDHAPHLLSEKKSNFPPSGMPGLESAFYALYSLYEKNILSLEIILKLMTSGYKIFKIKNRGKLKKNYFADITIIKKEHSVFNANKTETKADFSPFDGLKTNCKIDTVLINGNIILENNKLKTISGENK